MGKFAVVAPLDVHKRLEEEGELGTYQLLLAHEVLADPNGYYEFWHSRSLGMQIIMDNSLIELGRPLPIDVVAEAAELVGARTLVLPDVLGDRSKTYKLFAGALNQARAQDIDKRFNLLGVAQGATTNETFSCARDMLEAGATAISVPRRLTDDTGTRTEAVRLIGKLTEGKVPIHLLGFSRNLWDDMYCLRYPGVTGIDSALPIWLGMRWNLHDGTEYELPKRPPVVANYGRRPGNYSDWKGSELPAASIDNVRRVREWVNTVGVALTETSQEQLVSQET